MSANNSAVVNSQGAPAFRQSLRVRVQTMPFEPKGHTVGKSQGVPALRQSRRVKVQTAPFEAQHPTVAVAGPSKVRKFPVASNKKPQPRSKRAPVKRALPCDYDADSDDAPVTKKGKYTPGYKKNKDKGKGKEVQREVSPSADEYESDSTIRECSDGSDAGDDICDEDCSCHRGTGYEARDIVDHINRRERCIAELGLRHNLKTGFAARRMVNGIRSQLEIAKKNRGPNESFSNRQYRFRLEATIIQYEREEADREYGYYRTFEKTGAVCSTRAVDPSTVAEELASLEISTFPTTENQQVDRARSFLSGTTIDLTSTTDEEASAETSTFTTPERHQFIERNAFGRTMETTSFSFKTPEVNLTVMDLAVAAERHQQSQIPAFNFDPLPIFGPSYFPTSSLR